MKWLICVASIAASILASGCGSRASRINDASMSFMTKDPDLEARRSREAAQLVKLGAFYEGMSPDEVKQVLGAPTFVWRAETEDREDMDGYELQYVYRLDGSTSLRADFNSNQLMRLRRQLEIRTVNPDSGIDLYLRPKPR